AILIDLSFFITRYAGRERLEQRPLDPKAAARAVCRTARLHLKHDEELYRVLVYDCKPLAKKAHNPISGRAVDFAKTATYVFRSELLAELVRKRKVAVRLGELADRRRWLIRAEPTRRLLNGSMQIGELCESDVLYDVEQKGVDVKMSLDIAALA